MGCPPPRRQVSASLLKITRGGGGEKGPETGLSQTPAPTSLSRVAVCLSGALPPFWALAPPLQVSVNCLWVCVSLSLPCFLSPFPLDSVPFSSPFLHPSPTSFHLSLLTFFL